MDPPPNAPRSPNGRDFAARAEGERVMNERGLVKWVNAKLLDVLYEGLDAKSGGASAARWSSWSTMLCTRILATLLAPAFRSRRLERLDWAAGGEAPPIDAVTSKSRASRLLVTLPVNERLGGGWFP